MLLLLFPISIDEILRYVYPWFHFVILQAVPVPAHCVVHQLCYLIMTKDTAYQVLLDIFIDGASLVYFVAWLGISAVLISDLLSLLSLSNTVLHLLEIYELASPCQVRLCFVCCLCQ